MLIIYFNIAGLIKFYAKIKYGHKLFYNLFFNAFLLLYLSLTFANFDNLVLSVSVQTQCNTIYSYPN